VDARHQPCLDRASRYLSYRPRSEFEVKRYLKQKGFDDSAIAEVLAELREKRLLDDYAFAQFWKENRESFSPRSQAMLRRELRSKGVARQIADEMVVGVNEDGNAYRAAQKRARKLAQADYNVFRSKLASFLRQRGFGYEVIEHTVRRLWQEEVGNA